MRKAIVTGATGFVGSYLIRKLISEGTKVFAVIRPNTDNYSNLPKSNLIQPIQCDLSEIKILPKMIEDTDLDVFYHLAWNGSTGAARGDYELQLSNVQYTADAAIAAAELHCARFVGAGTLAEYDCYAYAMEDGSHPRMVSIYGAAKIAAHFISKAKCCELGLEHVWTYISNTYGVGNKTQNFVNFASNLMISGGRAAFTSGEQLYDFVYVSDVACALALLGEKGQAYCAYYIGSTQPRQLKEYITKIRNAIDPSIPLYLGEVPFQGTALQNAVFDCSKLVQDTGYYPRMPFDEGIKETVEWLKSVKGQKNGPKI